MTDDLQRFLRSQANQPPTFTEIPAPLPPSIEQLPNGFLPMEGIALEGQAYRGLSGGGAPWWVLIAGWVFFGVPTLVILGVAIWVDTSALVMLPLSAMMLIFLVRGTRRKLAADKEKAQRRARYRRASAE